MFLCRRHEGGCVGGHADHVDVFIGVEQGTDALTHQDVVFTEDHPDVAHAASRLLRPCTIRA
jgi:hypothetical protein